MTSPDDSSELRQWRVAQSRILASRLPQLEQCFHGIEKVAYVDLRLTNPKTGAPDPRIVGSTLDNCSATQCVLEILQTFSNPNPPPAVAPETDLTVQEILTFDPHGDTRLRLGVTPDVPLSPEGPCVDHGGIPTSRRLPPEHIQGVIRAAAPVMRGCFERGLGRDANLHGRLVTRFVIGSDGRVQHVQAQSNSLPDCEVVACIQQAYASLRFDKPMGGVVTVVYPLNMEPADFRR